jgi:hypothetical protein
MTPNDRQYEQLSAYIDGELSESARAEVEGWLAGDADARRLLDELRHAARLVGGLRRAAAPKGLSAEVMARREREALLGAPDVSESATRRVPIWQRGLAIAASLALIVTASWLMWPELPKPPSQRPTITVADAEDAGVPREQSLREAKSREEKPPQDQLALATKSPPTGATPPSPMALQQAPRSDVSKDESPAVRSSQRRALVPETDSESAEEKSSQPTAAVGGVKKESSSQIAGLSTSADAGQSGEAAPPRLAITRAKWRYVAPKESAGVGGSDQPIVHRLYVEVDSPARENIIRHMRGRRTPGSVAERSSGNDSPDLKEALARFAAELTPVRINDIDDGIECIYDLDYENIALVEQAISQAVEQEVDVIEQDVVVNAVEPKKGLLKDTAFAVTPTSRPEAAAQNVRLIVTIRPISDRPASSQPAGSQPSTQSSAPETQP